MVQREFPSGLGVKMWHFHCRGPGLIPGWGTKIPQAEWCGQKKKKKIVQIISFTFFIYDLSDIFYILTFNGSIWPTNNEINGFGLDTS